MSVARLLNSWAFWYLELDWLRVNFIRDEFAEVPPCLGKLGSFRRVIPTRKSQLQNVVSVIDRAFSAWRAYVPNESSDGGSGLKSLTRIQQNEIRSQQTSVWFEIRRVLIQTE